MSQNYFKGVENVGVKVTIVIVVSAACFVTHAYVAFGWPDMPSKNASRKMGISSEAVRSSTLLLTVRSAAAAPERCRLPGPGPAGSGPVLRR